MWTQIKTLLKIRSMLPLSKVCKRCGYNFNQKTAGNVCSKICFDKLLSTGKKRRDKIIKRHRDAPWLCATCSAKLSLSPNPEIGGICPKCDNFQYY